MLTELNDPILLLGVEKVGLRARGLALLILSMSGYCHGWHLIRN